MVAKIAVGASLYGALSYNQSKIEEDKGKILSTQKIYANDYGEIDLHSCMQSFALHIRADTKTEKPIVHISLNPHPDDTLTDEQLAKISKEYLEGMGYGEQPFIIYRHSDIKRTHVHIVTTNVDKMGRKINDSFEHRRSMKICRDIEQRYNLHKAEQKKKNNTFNLKRLEIDKGDIKNQINNIIKPIAATYRFQSFNEYRTLLAQYNIHVEQSEGVRAGNSYAGLIYYATNEKGIKASNPFKSSLFGKSVGYQGINEKINKSKEQIKRDKLNLQSCARVRDALHRSVDKNSFIDSLKAKNIDVIFRKNDAGRIYGTSFIDHNNHCIFNGSRLGQELSANAISDWFNNPQVVEPNPQNQHEQGEGLNQDAESTQILDSYDSDDFSFGSLFDLPIDSGIDDPEEERFRRAMQRKRKKKGRKI
ncbi:MAG: conjugal transfer protein MobB [Rikenellaceae bacterium]